MTVPKKPLTKNESAIQLGNILKGGPRGGGSKKGVIKKIKKLLKIGEKPSKNSNPIKEVKKAKKSLQNQKVNKSAKVPIEKLEQEHAIKTVVNKLNARTPIKIPKAQAQSSKRIPTVRSHPGLGGKIVDKPRPDASLKRAIDKWKKKKDTK